MAGAAKRTGLTASLLAASLALAACSDDVAGRSVPLDSFSAEQIYRLAEVELAAGAPAEAATYFGEVERLYPYSEWAKRALIMQAFAYHRDRD
jgi:outer membrane protein assembly factor BamD